MFAAIYKTILHHNPKTTIHFFATTKTSEPCPERIFSWTTGKSRNEREKENRKCVALSKCVVCAHM
jgi:hypothetical protein